MAYYVPPSKKVGGPVPRVPHLIAPMIAALKVVRGSKQSSACVFLQEL